ncbi:hypothetical protein [Xylanibacter ruminicola]|nr:hypothetical protein [Xylanibacter ruminicola]
MKNFFIADSTDDYSLVEDQDGRKLIAYTSDNDYESGSTSLQKLIEELNKYVRQNVGTTDFAVIQNKTERFTETIFENSTSNLSMPTYIGLMGTFTGVFLGLFVFSVNLMNLDDDGKINGLIYGVMISMLTSLCGLFLTTKSNHQASRAKKKMDERKNVFYDFIQNQLMPTLGTSVVESLAKLKDTINNFVPAFDTVIKKFHDTFDECTKAFGDEFRKNVTVVTDAVKIMGENIGELNEVSTNVKSLLVELRTEKMTETLDKFVDSVHSLDSLEENIVYLEQQKEFLNTSTQELMDAQEAYLLSLELPQDIVNKLKSILDRFVNFEDNINKFGEGLAQNQLIGNREINLIQQQINALEKNTKVINNFQELSTEELEKVCSAQIDDVNTLTKKYTEAISTHSDEFKEFMESVAREIVEKKKEFIEMLESAFTVSDIRTEFKQLNKIPGLLEKLESIDKALKADSDLVEKLEDIRLSTVDVFDSVDKFRTNNPLIDSVDDLKNNHSNQLQKIEETKNYLDTSLSDHMQLLSSIQQKLDVIWDEGLEKGGQNVISKINGLTKEFDEVKRLIASIPTERIPTEEIKALDKKIEEIDRKLQENNIGDRRTSWSIFGR